MRIYVSLPITGHEETAPDLAKRVQEELRMTFPEAEVITPFDIVPVGSGLDYAECMGKDITELLKSDAICVVSTEGFEESKGMALECVTADIYNIDCYVADVLPEKIDIYRNLGAGGFENISRHGKD